MLKKMERGYYTYMLECADGTLYTGWTTDVAQRVARHNQGLGAKYTRTRRPVVLRKFWAFCTKTEAMQLEYRLKRLDRRAKQALLDAGLQPLHDRLRPTASAAVSDDWQDD